ncbi:MAG: hypothetical protein KOO63_00970 [Bacteroidales bacterium]|nr:hypothetical protein [Candidatus Latescibacterota bacterium]
MKKLIVLLLILSAFSIFFYACNDDPTSAIPDGPPVNEPPVVQITNPSDGEIIVDQMGTFFIGSAIDPEDGELPPDSLVWKSNKDGVLGKGKVFLCQELSVNNHTITLTAIDSGGNRRSDTVKIHVWESIPRNIKVLFIGSSYFGYNNLPLMFKTLAEAAGKGVEIGEYIVGGMRLDYHSTNPATEAKINEEDWDFVILQGSSITAAYPIDHQYIFPPFTYHPLVPSLKLLKEKIEANCASTKTVYMMPWAYENGNTWVEGYDDTYFDMQLLIYDNTILFSDEVPFMTAPVGWAWNTVLSEVEQLHYLYTEDMSHPSYRGSYLLSCVIYSTFFREDLEGTECYLGIPRVEAVYFQSVAADIVLDDMKLWNLIP